MKKAIAILMCVFLVMSVCCLSGCSEKNTSGTETRTIVDMRGKTVEIPTKIENYGILYSSAVGICGMLDEGFKNVRVLPNLWIFEDWTYKMFPNLPNQVMIVDKNNVTAEQIVENGTQLIFWSNQSEELIASLENFGIACVNVAFQSDEELLKSVEIIAETLGTDYAKNKAKLFSDDMTATSNEIAELSSSIPENEKTSVLFLSAPETLTGFGKKSYEYSWAKKMNLNYILPSDENANKINLTMEQILEFDPDAIIYETVIDEESIYSDPIWSELRAAKNKKLIGSPCMLNVWAKSGMENIMTYKWAMSTFYPDYSKNIDLSEELIDFCYKYFNYSMSPEEAEIVLSGKLPSFNE